MPTMSNHGLSAELLQLLKNLPLDQPRSKFELFRVVIQLGVFNSELRGDSPHESVRQHCFGDYLPT
jgi:hypothetical protein